MKYLQIFILTALVLICLSTQFISKAWCKDTEISSVWTGHQIAIDGLRGDWPEGSLSTLPDREASFGLSNDSTFVYVMLSFRNPQWARTIKMSGLTVWLDPGGKKKKIFMVKLIGGPTREEIMKASGRIKDSADEARFSQGQERMGERFQKKDTVLLCSQADYLVEKPIPLDGSQGPASAFGVDHSFFVYEFKVPLKESDVMYYGLGVKPNKPISVGLIWGDMDRSKMDGDRGGFHGGMGGMGGGMGGGPEGPGGDMGEMPGGGGRGGPGGGGMGGPGGRRMPEKQEVWIKATLAAPTSPAH